MLQIRSHTARRAVGAGAVAGASLLALAGAAGAAGASGTPTSFTANDLVVYEALGSTSSSAAASLVDYSTAGVPSGYAVTLPTSDSGQTHALTESGSALNDGELTLSADGQSLVAPGYDAAPGVAKITSATGVARTVAVVSPTGSVDTSTSLTDTTTEAQNFRSATSASAGAPLFVGGGSGAAVVPDGGTSAAYLNADNVHEVQIVGGQLYESTVTGIYQVGSGLPASGPQTATALVTSANAPAGFDPDQFALVTLGAGPGPDTLYVADGANGAPPKTGATGPDQVEKYSLESGAWVLTGTVSVPLAVGLVAQATNGVAHVYVTGATVNTAGNNTVLYGITDSSHFGGTLTGSPTTLATAPAGDDFHGLAFAPVATAPAALPESPLSVGLPIAGVALLGGGFLALRRRTTQAG